ncbi:hypothetical protein ACFLYP_04160 [Chloroflexota bacterium]
MTDQEAAPEEVGGKRLENLFWAGVLILAGLIFGAESMGILPKIGDSDSWSWIFLGAGLYGFALNFYRLSSPDHATPTTWDYIWSGIFLIIGLGGFTAFDISWPLILILVGVVTLVNAFRRG